MHIRADQDKHFSAGNVEGTDMCRHDGPAILSYTDPVLWQFTVYPSPSGLQCPDECRTVVYNEEKADPLHATKTYGEVAVYMQLHSFFSSAPNGDEWSTSRSGHLTPRKQLRNPLFFTIPTVNCIADERRGQAVQITVPQQYGKGTWGPAKLHMFVCLSEVSLFADCTN